MTQMTIREKGYHQWEGQLKSSKLQWLPMFFNGIKTLFKKRFAKIVFFLCSMPFFVFLLGIYVSMRPELRILKPLVQLVDNEPRFFAIFLCNGVMSFLLILLGIFIGAELISGDIKFNAFPLFFSRPLNRNDYLLGKFSVMMFYLLLFTGVPGIILYLFKILFTGKIAFNLYLILGLFIVPVLQALFIASIILLLSSLGRNSRYIKVFIFVIYFLSKGIASLLVEIFNNSYFHLVSIPDLLKQMANFIFNISPKYSYPGWVSLAVVIAVIAGVYMLLYKRMAKLEAQIENGH